MHILLLRKIGNYTFKMECKDVFQARKIEKQLKAMKSRKYILNLVSYPEIAERLLKLYHSE